MGPCDLEKILSRVTSHTSERVLSSLQSGEDAGVFALDDKNTLVQSVDFFPPIVDDPYTFGQIAAANALSDIYAMNGTPLTAMNILGAPCTLDLEIISLILRGGEEKIREARADIIGGHTIEDDELKYGLCITGTLDRKNMWQVKGALPEDILILTKPVGTGILSTALKAQFISEDGMEDAIVSMRSLNSYAAEILSSHRVHACTDVTGFGLIGHLKNICVASNVSAAIRAKEVPLFGKTHEMASLGMIPAGQKRNKEYVLEIVKIEDRVDELLAECLFDPQTSGGLLASVHPDDAKNVLDELKRGPCPHAALIGSIEESEETKISIDVR
ncbi:MAG: selenide, water dikinase SelD [Actinomycetota bacterium]|nr:selenide, water dikinase SelD [Actinomycetota bacterium]